jgi:Type VI secretion system/phage-baseplate injector OB domain
MPLSLVNPLMMADDSEDTPESGRRYYGKYRGVVFNHLDPLQIGRIQAIVPDTTGLIPSTWALPCLPIAGIQNGSFLVPLPGTNVWIEYEQGNLDYPIWVGMFYGSTAEVPLLAKGVKPGLPQITFQTSPLTGMTINDDILGPSGGITLQSGPASISISAKGLILKYGPAFSIRMDPTGVDINNKALTIT